MNGTATNSNFIILGKNAFTCDVLGTIEMGFHPAITPGTIRPFSFPTSNIEGINFLNLSSIRKTSINFLPSSNQNWLFKSINMKKKRIDKLTS